jgi:hypothetical protein
MIDKALGYLEGGQYWLASVVIVFAVIVNIEKILSIIDIQKKKRLTLLKDAISDESVPEKLKSHLKDEIQAEYFYQAHKIRMDKFKRDLLIETHNKLKGEITLKQFKKANNQLIVKDEKLQVDITKIDNLSLYYNMFFGVLMAILGFVLLSVSVSLNEPSIYKVINWLILCLFLISFGFFMVYQTFPIITAKRIRKALHAI